jgi:hypothetical protein
MKNVRIAFLLSLEDDGLDAMAQALSAHPKLHVARDAHVMTALAHLGYYEKVDKAAYDHVLAAEAQRLFVDRLPGKETDYVAACRAYCDTLYLRVLEASGKDLFVDATTEYLGILPFLRRIYPEAPCVVLTRHPLVLLARHGAPVARKAIEAAANLLRDAKSNVLRVRAEDFAAEPSAQVDAVCASIGVPFDAALGEVAPAAAQRIAAVEQAASEIVSSERLAQAQRFIRRLATEDLAAYGYPPEALWLPLDAAAGRILPRVAPARLATVRRRALTRMRRTAQRPGAVGRLVRKARLACDVLLRR